jgi:hypothetical protein
MNDGPRQRGSKSNGAARVYGQGWGRSVSVGQCRIVAAELRGTNSDLKTGGGLRRNRGGVQRGGVRPPVLEGIQVVLFGRVRSILAGSDAIHCTSEFHLHRQTDGRTDIKVLVGI